jgi:hypothetical protein
MRIESVFMGHISILQIFPFGLGAYFCSSNPIPFWPAPTSFWQTERNDAPLAFSIHIKYTDVKEVATECFHTMYIT